jgi:hypothetical protein
VCDECSRMVAQQKSPSSTARFRSVSAQEAAAQALSSSMSPTSMSRSGSTHLHRHVSSISGTHGSSIGGSGGCGGGFVGAADREATGRSGRSTMACVHCRQQAVCQRATDIDGMDLWLCPSCADTQRQFSQAHAAASSTAAAVSPSRRATWETTSSSAHDRGLQLQNALDAYSSGARSSSPPPTTAISPTSPMACHNRAWNRVEAMEMLEQHEWSQANTSSANTMADELNDRYADTIQRGSPPARVRAHDGSHPANCPCGLCE